MRTIFKYPMGDILMPKGAKVLSTGIQDRHGYIWAEVDTEQTLETRTFKMFGTGWKMPETQNVFIGTLFDGDYVWHVFEMVNS